jgi:putative ABC transport system permease protein
LLIACANVASLLLARSTARATEMAMRVSLGAARRRLIRQMLTESLLLSLLAGGLGWLLARAGAPLLVRLLSIESNPVEFALAIDTRVLLFCIGVSTLSALLFGLIPAWQASSAQPMISLRSSTGQAGKLRLGKLFVTIQVACAFCLVVTGAAFLFSLSKLFQVNPGFDAKNVAVLNITTEAGKKAEEAQRALMFDLERRVANEPGVEAAALAAWPIFLSTGWDQRIVLPGKGPSERQEIFYRVSPGYFATLRTPLLAGRDFEARDSNPANPTPAIVNAAFARRYFGSLDVLGREFAHQFGNSLLHKVIVGVASDAYYYDLRRGAEPIL